MIAMMAFVGVAGLVGVLAFVFRDTAPQDGDAARHAGRQAQPRGRRAGRTSSARRRSRTTRRSLLEMLTPKFSQPQKMFEQADCHIKPSTLFGIGLLLAALGATVTVLAQAADLVLLPLNGLVHVRRCRWLWLWNKRRVRLKKFAVAAVRRAGTGGPGAAGRAQPGGRHARRRRGNAVADRRRVRPRLRGAEPGHPDRGGA